MIKNQRKDIFSSEKRRYIWLNKKTKHYSFYEIKKLRVKKKTKRISSGQSVGTIRHSIYRILGSAGICYLITFYFIAYLAASEYKKMSKVILMWNFVIFCLWTWPSYHCYFLGEIKLKEIWSIKLRSHDNVEKTAILRKLMGTLRFLLFVYFTQYTG